MSLIELPSEDTVEKLVWDPDKLYFAIGFLSLHVEPPLNDDEGGAIIGLLNQVKSTTPEDEQLRFDMMSAANRHNDGLPYDERSFAVHGVLKSIAENRNVVATELNALQPAPTPSVEV